MHLFNKKTKKSISIILLVYVFLISFNCVIYGAETKKSNARGQHNSINYIGPIIEEEKTETSKVINNIGDAIDIEFHTLKSNIRNGKPFDIVKFGEYEQDNNFQNGKEAIEWYILAKDDKKAFLISKYILDCRKFHNCAADITWEDSNLREWINTDFYNEAFSYKDKTIILDSYNQNKKNYYYNTNSGNPTIDKVFVLSIEEAIMYFEDGDDYYLKQQHALKPNDRRKAIGTPYAIANGLRVSFKENENLGCGNYWLRTLGRNEDREWYSGIFAKYYAAIVQEPGYIKPMGTAVHSGDDGVRPAIWISIE